MGSQAFQLEPEEKATLPEDAQAYCAILEECSVPNERRWTRLREQRASLRAEWDRFFQQWDVLICPVFPTEAFEHDLSGEGMAAQLQRRRQVDRESHVYMSQLSWPGLVTVANLPATAVPVPQRDGELPIGVQIVGPAFEDRTPLRVAELMELELGYRAAPPPIAILAPAG
jgi:amidase